MTVQFGGQSSPQHQVVLRFGPMEWNGAIPGHLVAQTSQGPIAARRAIVWDPLLDTFSMGDRHEFERLFERLDPLAALAGSVNRSIVNGAQAVGSFMGEMLNPRFIIVGGLGAILFGYLFYYWLWLFAAKYLLLYGLLPGGAVAIASGVFYDRRLRCLRVQMSQAAWHALQPETYHAPR